MNSAKSRKRQLFLVIWETNYNQILIGLYSFRKTIIIAQNLNHVHVTYHKLLIFFWLTLVGILYWNLKIDFSRHQKNTVRKYVA